MTRSAFHRGMKWIGLFGTIIAVLLDHLGLAIGLVICVFYDAWRERREA